MINLRLVERVDGTWCAYVEGQEEDAVAGPTDDAALGRLVREQPERFGVGAVGVTPLDPRLGGELGRHVASGPDFEAPPVRRDRGAAPSDDLI